MNALDKIQLLERIHSMTLDFDLWSTRGRFTYDKLSDTSYYVLNIDKEFIKIVELETCKIYTFLQIPKIRQKITAVFKVDTDVY
jgi:cytolysin (calcineurin-like family phosphatase)